MNKLIKLSETHYIVVDDSEIKEGDYAIHNNKEYRNKYNEKPILCTKSNCESIQEHWDKITHSTQPLELIDWENGAKGKRPAFDKIKPLSLSGVEDAINGYSVEKMAEEEYPINRTGSMWMPSRHEVSNMYRQEGYIKGFNVREQLAKDKVFTVEDVENIWKYALGCAETHDKYGTKNKSKFIERDVKEFIQSLLPKTEWEVEFNEQGKIVLL